MRGCTGTMPPSRRIGVTMRAAPGATHREPFDAMETGWTALLTSTLAQPSFVPIPNLGRGVEGFVDHWQLEAIILTGGDDLGGHPVRDRSERALLAICVERRLPVLGICRGLQLVQDFFGGSIGEASEEHGHGRLHELTACDELGRSILGGRRATVPSFHRRAVHRDTLVPALHPWAMARDGVVEGVRHVSAPILAAQWHPERALPDPGLGRRLLEAFLCLPRGG